MSSTNWLDPNWRHELSNGVILWMTIGVLAGVGGLVWWWIRNVAAVSLLASIGAGAVVGGAIAALVWTVVPRMSGQEAAQKAEQSAPLYVTGVELIGPFIAGERLKARLHLFCERGLTIRARGSARFVHVVGGGHADYERNRRGIEDEVVWQPFESSSELMDKPDLISLPKGPYSMDLEPMTLQPHNVEAIAGGTAIVYLAGQIDFGGGALDYCYAWRPTGNVKPCLAHNGWTKRSVY